MDRTEIKKKIMQISEETVGAVLQENETLKESGVDSLSLAMLVAYIEESFGITFSDDDLQPEKLNSLTSLVDLTEKYI